jgi:hypothetical protein
VFLFCVCVCFYCSSVAYATHASTLCTEVEKDRNWTWLAFGMVRAPDSSHVIGVSTSRLVYMRISKEHGSSRRGRNVMLAVICRIKAWISETILAWDVFVKAAVEECVSALAVAEAPPPSLSTSCGVFVSTLKDHRSSTVDVATEAITTTTRSSCAPMSDIP